MKGDDPSAGDDSVVRNLAELSTTEIVNALGARGAPVIVRAVAAAIARGPSVRLGRALARFDARIGTLGLDGAARAALSELGAIVDVEGACPDSGPLLVVVNHPGAFDAFALMLAIARPDIAFVASERPFLRAMPRLSDRMIFLGEGSPSARALGVRNAMAWLRRGRALVQFGAGSIEPDVRFVSPNASVLAPWPAGTGLLARVATRSGARIIPGFVQGVHSPRAKRLFFVRWAERRNVTTIAPLVQATLPGFRDVRVSVRFGSAVDGALLAQAVDDQERTRIVRNAVLDLVTTAR